MALTGPLSFHLPEDAARELGQRARARRLAGNLSRKTLAAQSGVPAATIRLFETTGKLGVVAMLKLADALGCLDGVAGLFPQKATKTLDEFVAPKRRRGMK